MKIDKGRISFWWHYKNPSTISNFFYRLQTYDFIRTSLLKMSHKIKFENDSWISEIINIDEVRNEMRHFYWFSSTVAWRKKEELGREATGYERLLGASLDQWQDVLFTLFPPQKEELSLLLRREREGFFTALFEEKVNWIRLWKTWHANSVVSSHWWNLTSIEQKTVVVAGSFDLSSFLQNSDTWRECFSKRTVKSVTYIGFWKRFFFYNTSSVLIWALSFSSVRSADFQEK